MNRQPRATRTVEDVAGPYANYLLTVPAAGADTCRVCHGAVYDGYSTCYPCKQAASVLGSGVADLTSFVSLAPAGEQFARELYTYKRDTVPDAIRGLRLIGLAAELWKWLSIHESCLLPPAPAGGLPPASGGGPRFDLVTSVPSTSGRDGVHPLRTLVRDLVDGAADRYDDVLRVARTDLPPRESAPVATPPPARWRD